MSENVTARDLLTESIWRINESQSIRDAIRFLVATSPAAQALVAVDERAAFVGLLTPRLLLQELLRDWKPEVASDDPVRWHESLLDVAEERLEDPVGEILVRDVSCAAPGDGILRLLELTSDQRLECVPVVENQRVIGIVRSVAVFRVAAALALAPGDGETPAAGAPTGAGTG